MEAFSAVGAVRACVPAPSAAFDLARRALGPAEAHCANFIGSTEEAAAAAVRTTALGVDAALGAFG